MLRTYLTMANFSIRLKGPAKNRLKLKESSTKIEQQRKEDYFNNYAQETIELYKNNFTESELQGSNDMVKRVFSLQNATAGEILKFRIEQAVKKYQRSLTDVGNAAIQCASMSQKLILMMVHIKKYPKDVQTALAISRLLHKRRKMLHYLQRTDFHRYKWVCIDYGIPEIPPRDAHHKTHFVLKNNSWAGY